MFLDELVKTQTLYDDEVNPGHRNIIINTASNGIYENIPHLDEERDETALQSLESAKKMMQGLLTKIDNTIAIANIKQCQVFEYILNINLVFAHEKPIFSFIHLVRVSLRNLQGSSKFQTNTSFL